VHRGLRVPEGHVHGSRPIVAAIRFADDGEYADAVAERVDLGGQRALAATLDRVTFRSSNLSGCELERCQLTDVQFETCDLSGLVLLGCSLMRVTFSGCRVGGLAMSRGGATTLAMESCRGDSAAFFSLEGKEWRIEDCELTNVDCRELRLNAGVFERCDLTGADFTGAAVKATFTGCVLERVGGAGGLAGSTIDVPTLMSVAPGLAKALGMTVTG
jgi:uncharacterized protein YjbI with pentapeptide repeats